MDGGLNPKIDFVFRKLFGSEKNKDMLISLINSVVDPTPPIVDVSIKNPFNLAEYKTAKESILDIKAVDEAGTWYDIEMQVEAHTLYGLRAIYYLCKTYADQLQAGADYSKLNTAIGIHFLDFRYFDDDRVLRQFVLKDAETGDASPQLSSVRLYFVEMPKFAKDLSEVRTALDRWVAFLNKAQEINPASPPRALADEPAVAKAIGELRRMGSNARERAVYEGEVKKRMVDATQLESAELRGRQEGLQEGRQEGRQEGMQDILIRQIERRLGRIPHVLESRLRSLSADETSDLALDIFYVESIDDVERWLKDR